MARKELNNGTTPGDGTGDVLYDIFEDANDNFIEVYKNTGWESIVDTTYTLASPLAILDGNTSTLFNDGGSIIADGLPSDVTSFYDIATNKITPQLLNDYYMINIRFKAESTVKDSYFDVGLDVGTPILPLYPDGIIFEESKIFNKASGVTHDFNVILNGYAGAIFLANGGIPKVTAHDGDVLIYNIEFQICRTYRAK